MSKPKFKIEDKVRIIADTHLNDRQKGDEFIVGYIQSNGINSIPYSYEDGKKHNFVFPENYLELVEHHEGKVLIMVDKDNANKVVARDLVTGKTAEAKRNPKDEWDFEKGAKLAFQRLFDEEEKYYTGKVVCVEVSIRTPMFFTKGKVYSINNGILKRDSGTTYANNIKTIDDLNKLNGHYCKFIEYKGGTEE